MTDEEKRVLKTRAKKKKWLRIGNRINKYRYTDRFLKKFVSRRSWQYKLGNY